MSTQLTREQKLMAEQVVQLGNIAEAIRAAAMGQDSSDLMEQIAATYRTQLNSYTTTCRTTTTLLNLHTSS